MLRQLFDHAKQLFNIKQHTEKNTADIREIRQELKELTTAIQELKYEVQRNHDNAAHEREILTLRLENTLLRFERRLLSGRSDDESET